MKTKDRYGANPATLPNPDDPLFEHSKEIAIKQETEILYNPSYDDLTRALGETFHPDRTASAIRENIANGTMHMVKAGMYLMLGKTTLNHGDFQTWVEMDVGVSIRTAQNYMQLARFFGSRLKNETVSLLPAKKLLAIANEAPEYIDELEETGELLGLTMDDIQQMNVKKLKEWIHKMKKVFESQSGVILKHRATLEEKEAELNKQIKRIEKLERENYRLQEKLEGAEEEVSREGCHPLRVAINNIAGEVNDLISELQHLESESDRLELAKRFAEMLGHGLDIVNTAVIEPLDHI